MPTFTEVVGALLAVGALLVTAYAAIYLHNDQAVAAVINLLLIGAGFFLRGKIAPPGTPNKFGGEIDSPPN